MKGKLTYAPRLVAVCIVPELTGGRTLTRISVFRSYAGRHIICFAENSVPEDQRGDGRNLCFLHSAIGSYLLEGGDFPSLEVARRALELTKERREGVDWKERRPFMEYFRLAMMAVKQDPLPPLDPRQRSRHG